MKSGVNDASMAVRVIEKGVYSSYTPDLMSINSRLQWIPQAGRGLYLIYNGG